jgi:hypothetical protein
VSAPQFEPGDYAKFAEMLDELCPGWERREATTSENARYFGRGPQDLRAAVGQRLFMLAEEWRRSQPPLPVEAAPEVEPGYRERLRDQLAIALISRPQSWPVNTLWEAADLLLAERDK